jgi:hypothetical protein
MGERDTQGDHVDVSLSARRLWSGHLGHLEMGYLKPCNASMVDTGGACKYRHNQLTNFGSDVC